MRTRYGEIIGREKSSMNFNVMNLGQSVDNTGEQWFRFMKFYLCF